MCAIMAVYCKCVKRKVFEGFNYILGMAGANFMACILPQFGLDHLSYKWVKKM